MEGATRDQINDALVLDCCEWYSRHKCGGSKERVILCSRDHNLSISADPQGELGEGHAVLSSS